MNCFYLKCVQNNSNWHMLILHVKYFYLQIRFFVLDTVLLFSKSSIFNFWKTNSDFITTK